MISQLLFRVPELLVYQDFTILFVNLKMCIRNLILSFSLSVDKIIAKPYQNQNDIVTFFTYSTHTLSWEWANQDLTNVFNIQLQSSLGIRLLLY